MSVHTDQPSWASVPAPPTPLSGDWQTRLSAIVSTMKDMSRQTDPQEMVRAYGVRMQQLMPVDRRVSLSRRGLQTPEFKVTRYSGWRGDVNPWKEEQRLPLLSGGVFADLIYGDEPRILSDLDVPESDPAYEYIGGQRSLLALPLYDQGVALNMVIVTRTARDAFSPEELPERVWMSNLFGRATQNLVLAEQLDLALKEVDRELQAVADMQRSLLPSRLPEIPTLKLAAHYQTSKRAGGDYYDFLPMSDGRWGLLIADVSGHGTPAAVMMAITHCIAHMRPAAIEQPSEFLEFLNQHLTARYTSNSGHFVTAFFAIYDPKSGRLVYASAGHNPPRLRRRDHQSVTPLDKANFLPLGIAGDLEYRNSEVTLRPGDRLVLYTDGITEAASPQQELFGTERLDRALEKCTGEPGCSIGQILSAVHEFTRGQPANDDRTLIVMDVG